MLPYIKLVKTRKMMYQEHISKQFYTEFEKHNEIQYKKWMLVLRFIKHNNKL